MAISSVIAIALFRIDAQASYTIPESSWPVTVQKTALCDPSRYAAEPFPTYSLDEYQKR